VAGGAGAASWALSDLGAGLAHLDRDRDNPGRRNYFCLSVARIAILAPFFLVRDELAVENFDDVVRMWWLGTRTFFAARSAVMAARFWKEPKVAARWR